MGRPRQYATDAERQRACRRRLTEQTVRVDRQALERLRAQLDRLQDAVYAAAQAGDALAQACYAVSHERLLERLACGFEAQARAATHETARPAPAETRRKVPPPS